MKVAKSVFEKMNCFKKCTKRSTKLGRVSSINFYNNL